MHGRRGAWLLVPTTERYPQGASELCGACNIFGKTQGGEQGIGLSEVCGSGIKVIPGPTEGRQIQMRPAEFIACWHGGKGRAGHLEVTLGLCEGPTALRDAA